MNVQAVFTKLNSRARISSIFCGIYAGFMWMILIFASLALGLAGTLGGNLFGKLGNIDSSGVVAGYDFLGNLFLSAVMGFAILAILACILVVAVPAVIYTIVSAGGFSKAKKEQTAIRTPGGVVDFRLFRKDAIYKMVISGVTIAFELWSQMHNGLTIIKKALEYRSLDGLHHRINLSMPHIGWSLLILGPAITVFVLAAMNLADINKWRKWLAAVRAQNNL